MPKSLPDKIKSFPFCFLLFPIFVVVHIWEDNLNYINFGDILLPGLAYLISSFAIFGIFLLVFRQVQKAGIFAFCLLAVFLLFGAIHDFLKSHAYLLPLSRYRYLLPILFLLLLIVIFRLRKEKSEMNKLNRFLSLLLLVFLLVDAGSLIKKTLMTKSRPTAVRGAANYPHCKECAKPDIYFLIFDEYASTRCLKDFWNYDNHKFDSSLQARGFHIIPDSRSNYNLTFFSVASILNMDYSSGIRDFKNCTLDDFTSCLNWIRNSAVVDLLERNGYQIVNHSIFDLHGKPSPENLITLTILPTKQSVIYEQTLLGRIKKAFDNLRDEKNVQLHSRPAISQYRFLEANERLMEQVLNEPRKRSDHPKFVYGHFLMPHQPYYFDSLGNPASQFKTLSPSESNPVDSYLQYLVYTNKKALQLVDSIRANNATPPIIILMGDHGLKGAIPGSDFRHVFMNMNAIYLPDKNYHAFPDNLSAVNQFRILFNSIFKQNFKPLKDSTMLIEPAN